MNVDLYIGGAEHAVLHLLYSRFWHKVLFDLGFVSTKEPFKKLRHQGTVLSASYQDSSEHYHSVDEVEFRDKDAYLKSTGEKLKVEVQKMAKSMLNGVNPDDVVAKYGADVLRLYEMFMGEFELPKPWDPRAIEGCNRFLRRTWKLVDDFDATRAPVNDPNAKIRNKTIKKVTNDIENMKFNTAVAAMMEYLNELYITGAAREDLVALVKLLGPYAPHIGDELWEILGEKGFLIDAPWPTWDEALTVDHVVTVVVQVNGKLRGEFLAQKDASQEKLKETALNLDKVKQYIEQGTIRKVIVIPGKLVNIVVS
jgi:leucyl-tRNA synthetase